MGTASKIVLGVVALGAVLCAGGALLLERLLGEGGDGINELVDPRPARVLVDVRDDADAPIAGARVEAYLTPPRRVDDVGAPFEPNVKSPFIKFVDTGADGTAEIPSLELGRWTLVARASGHATRTRRVEGGHAGRLRASFRLGAPLRLAGRVLDVDGAPIEDAVVVADESGGSPFVGALDPAYPRATCGPGGQFEFANLPAAPVRLWVARPSDLPFPWGEVLATDVRTLDLVLPRRVELLGCVTDDVTQKGVAFAGVRVSFFMCAGALGASTDAEGRYRILYTPPPDGCAAGVQEVRVESRGTPTYEVRAKPDNPGGGRNLDVRLAAGASVHGRIVGPAGPIAGAPVYVWQSAKNVEWRQRRATTDADGRYAVSDVAPGEVSVFAQPYGCAFENGREDRKLKPGDDVAVDFTLSPRDGASVVVRGRVESAHGAPIDGAKVTAMHHGSSGPEVLSWTSSSADGSFSFPPVPESAKLQLVVAAAGFRERTTEWDTADDFASGTTVRLTPGVRVEGRVHTRDDMPVAYARVAVGVAWRDGVDADPLGVLWADDDSVVADSVGRFVATYDGDAPTFVVVARAEGFAPTASAPTSPGVVAPIDLVLDTGLPIRGIVADESGRPLAGAVLGVHAEARWTQRQVALAVADASGRFEIARLPSRQTMLVLWNADRPATTRWVQPSADAELKFIVQR